MVARAGTRAPKEEKHSLWFAIVFFFFLVLKNTTIESFNIGPVTFKDITIISKILPLIFVYIFFNLSVISSHKKEVNFTIRKLSARIFNQNQENNSILPQLTDNFIIRMFLPFSFSNTVLKNFSNKPTFIEALIGFPLMLPVLVIGILPYVLTVYMLCDLWKNYSNDFFGVASFWLTLWAFCLAIFYVIKNAISFNTQANI